MASGSLPITPSPKDAAPVSKRKTICFKTNGEFDFYTERIARLTSLRHVKLCSDFEYDGRYEDYNVPYDTPDYNPLFDAQCFLEKYVACHGAAGKNLTFEYDAKSLGLTRSIVAVCALLNPLSPPPTKVNQLNLAQCAAHLNDTDFSCVKEATLVHSTQAEYSNLWALLLERCVGIESVTLIEDQGIRWTKRSPFEWAARMRFHGRCPPALLKDVKIRFFNPSLYSALNDLFDGFGPTLESVTLVSELYSETGNPWSPTRIVPKGPLPRLRVFEASVCYPHDLMFTFDHLPMLQQLETPKLYNRSVSVTRVREYSEQIHRQFPIKKWRVCRFPNLTTLRLSGRAAAEFNPACFDSMRKLEDLYLELITDDWVGYWTPSGWTWNWGFPALKKVEMRGWITGSFRLSALRRMPSIQSLRLFHVGHKNAEVSAIFDLSVVDKGAAHESGRTMQPDQGLFSSSGSSVLNAGIKEILIDCGKVIMDISMWYTLLDSSTFPALETLHVGGYSGVKNVAIIRQASRHPKLQVLRINSLQQQKNAKWPKKAMDRSWEHGGSNQLKEGHIFFRANHAWYHVPRSETDNTSGNGDSKRIRLN